MAFGDFDLRMARERLGLTLIEDLDLFAALPPADLNERVREVLSVWAPAALAINTEKARSEFIIAPVLLELRRKWLQRDLLVHGPSPSMGMLAWTRLPVERFLGPAGRPPAFTYERRPWHEFGRSKW